MTFEGEPAAIRDGASTVACGVDREGCWLAVTTPGHPEQIVRLPRWKGGVGGLELVVATDERYVALFIYSGQSTQGYELFALEPTLSHIGGLAESWGHGDAPVFSPGARWLVMFMDDKQLIRGSGEYFETVQDDQSEERVIVDWACLHVQCLPDRGEDAAPGRAPFDGLR